MSFRPLPFRRPHSIFQGGPIAHCLFVCPRGRNGYRKKSQHKTLTLEKKFLSPPLLPGLERATFRSRVRSSTTELPPPLPPSLPLLILDKYPLPRGEIEPAYIRGALESTLKQLSYIPTQAKLIRKAEIKQGSRQQAKHSQQ